MYRACKCHLSKEKPEVYPWWAKLKSPAHVHGCCTGCQTFYSPKQLNSSKTEIILFSQFMWSLIWNLVKLKNLEYQQYTKKKQQQINGFKCICFQSRKISTTIHNLEKNLTLELCKLIFFNIDSSWAEFTGLKGIFATFSTVRLCLLKCHKQNPSAVLVFNCKWMVFIQLVHFFWHLYYLKG